MSQLVAELQKLHQLYITFRKELDRALSTSDSDSGQAVINTTFDNRNRLALIEKTNAQVSQLASSWAKSENHLDPEFNNEIREIMAAIRVQAVQLEKLCAIHAQKLVSVRDMLGKELAQIEKGSQYLKSIKPAKQNYPKFIDSFC